MARPSTLRMIAPAEALEAYPKMVAAIPQTNINLFIRPLSGK
ncbi:MAG TPA: hypothetical protein VNN99_02465 [Vicinamibacterales bacterium]|nr:hypothetical protein [Vicinamibacterales bacterium]